MRRFTTAMACLATLTMLNGCAKEDSSTTSTKAEPQPKVEQVTALAVELIPDGHWLFNPMHCTKELPSTGVFDIKVQSNKVTYIGITQEGQWNEIDADAELAKKVTDYLSTDQANCLALDKDKLHYARFTAPGTQFDLIFSAEKGSMLLVSKEGIYPALKFDEKVLTTYKYVEVNTNELTMEQADEKPADDTLPVEYTNN